MTENRNSITDRVNPRMFRSEPLQRCALGECHGACCVFGVWMDTREVDDIIHHSNLILPHMPEDCRNPYEWFAGVEDKDPRSPSGKVIHTAVENRSEHHGGTACVFWLSDGKCALQVAADANRLHSWRFKPFYCILHPLDLDADGRITLDEVSVMINEPGSCVTAAPHSIPLVDTFEPEFRYLLGEKGFQELRDLSHQHQDDRNLSE